jgi:hypothetical protein
MVANTLEEIRGGGSKKTARVRGTPTQELEHQPNFWKKNYPQEGKAPLWEQKTPLPSEVL